MGRWRLQRSQGLLLDGEVVAYDGDQTSFTRLQQRLGVARPTAEQVAMYPVVFCVFDLLEVDGEVFAVGHSWTSRLAGHDD